MITVWNNGYPLIGLGLLFATVNGCDPSDPLCEIYVTPECLGEDPMIDPTWGDPPPNDPSPELPGIVVEAPPYTPPAPAECPPGLVDYDGACVELPLVDPGEPQAPEPPSEGGGGEETPGPTPAMPWPVTREWCNQQNASCRADADKIYMECKKANEANCDSEHAQILAWCSADLSSCLASVPQ